jgi:hypothetical protein
VSSSAYSDVKERSTFFFKLDENKKNTNLKVHHVEAPGNKHRNASVILPHEHVHPQHLMDTSDLNEDKLKEIYAYYTFMIDLHISQVRPQNLMEKSYIPAKFNQYASIFQVDQHLDNQYFEYYHRWREPTRTWKSQTQELDHEEEKKNAPKVHHWHEPHTMYDVAWTNE